MRGCIKFSNGEVVWFTDDDYQDIIGRLDDEQRTQLAALLRSRLGPSNPLPVDVDREVYESWYDDTHRKDVMLGGGAGGESAKINKKGGKKLSLKTWHDKGSSDQNIVWLRNMGFKKRWNKNVGYLYTWNHVDLDLTLIGMLTHEEFKIKVTRMMQGYERN